VTGPATTVRDGSFRAAMARFAAGVVVVTTRDAEGTPQGLTATSFCSVSLEPPLILVCVAETASAYDAFAACDEFAVSLLSADHAAVATRFATSGADKFRAEDTVLTPGLMPAVAGALGELHCSVYDRHRTGDHVILIGAVTGVRLTDGEPLLYYQRSFRVLDRP
jgi:flavin reductase ActVB